MGDVDAGTVKATVRIELDDSGIGQAEQRLESLKGLAGEFGASAGGVGETLVSMDQGAQRLASSMGALTPQLEASGKAMWQLVEGGAPGQQMLIGLGSAFESLQKPVESAVKQLESASSTMALLPEHTTRVSEEISAAGDSFAALGDTVGQSVIALPQFADSLHVVDKSFNAAQYGLNDFNENMNVFQDALVNPEPFTMIQQHLNETGQTWGDFTSSIGDNNTAMLHEMATNADTTYSYLGSLDKSINKFGGVGGGIYGPLESPEQMINTFGGVGGAPYEPASAPLAAKAVESQSFFSGLTNAMSQIAMPLMAVQMIGMAIGTVATGIYNLAALAEGPAAHSVGTFTGTIDALSQSAQKSGEAFSENFGQAILPTLNAMNSQSGQGGGLLGFLGSDIGNNLSVLSDLWQIGTGTNPVGGFRGLVNTGASWLGMPQPYQGPAPVSQAQTTYEQQMAALPTTVQGQVYQLRTQTSITLADALNPDYLQAQDQLTASQQLAQRLQASYNASHPINQNQLLADARYQQYVDTQGPVQYSTPSFGLDTITSYWGNIFGNIGKFLTQPVGGLPAGTQSFGASGFDFSGITGDLGQAFSSIHLPHLDLSGITSELSGAFSGIQLPHIDLSGIGSSLSGALSGIQMPHLDLSSISSSLAGAFSGISLPSIPDLGGRINSMLSGVFSGISLPSIPDIGAMLSGALSGMFAGISLPKPPDIGAMLSGTLDGIFSGIALPKPPDVGAMITGAMSGIFSGISLPPIPNIGAMLSGAMSVMLGGASSAIPGFAGGVENFAGGPAFIAEGGQPELVMLPQGSSVYPLSTGSAVGGNMTPISLGVGGGGGMPQSLNLHLQIGDAIISQMGIPLAQNMRLVAGYRGY